ncbi:hypothetical protein GCM10011348_26790 [Marinobacterium nitratireducens]|uniref:FecR protein domain-containing protein n=1 Tax=Marinobacterium nitratireducens TaxID=518897 RepID=A0A917ZH73_9GAMM|nr:TonB-dependent receptor [Marinobacterium nitratireducens]GGO83315.1 hypothetical protein GCM10011348_26790 [Marinobacterium nitratireducens]
MSCYRWFFILFIGFSWALSSNVPAADGCEPWVARIVSVEGQVEVKPAGKAHWQPMQANATLCADDSLRVGALSRAAIEFHRDTNLLRLEQNTVVTLSAPQAEQPSWIELLEGAVYFISRVTQQLNIRTKFLNASVEGTEFMVRVERERSMLWVFEGRVLASNDIGRLPVNSGEAAIARAGEAPVRHLVVSPRNAVQWALFYPPLIDYRGMAYWSGLTSRAVAHAVARYRAGDLPGAFAALDGVPAGQRDERYLTLRAGLLLSVGRVDEARSDIAKALDLDSNNATVIALQSVIAVVQNEGEKALSLAKQSIELDPQSPVPRVALSYAYQSNFEIEKAQASAQEAVDLAPGDALAWARLAELWLAMGYLDRALEAAQEAVVRNPELARTQTVLAFSHLTRFEIDQARAAFEKAIRLDQSDPLPRLGLGLAKVRKNDLEGGRREIEIAASLDPNNSSIRSTLGKAYYEERRDKLAGTELAIAKELDPNDPTPWFYDAIRKLTINRSVQALQDVQRSVKLNYNRAVYRSRLSLDDDLAARSAALGRVYSNLGFDQLALVEGGKSVNTDPGNYSAHRLFADGYAGLPRHEIAQASELLQSKLLQPLNVTPIQASIAATDLQILEGLGPTLPSFNEFNPLLLRERVAVQASGLVAGNDTLGEEVALSGIRDRFSYNLGQFHYESDGFRANNDLEIDIYDAFVQFQLRPATSVQAEYRRTERDQGELALQFGAEPLPVFRRERKSDSVRLGLHHTFSPSSELIGSVLYQDQSFKERERRRTQGFDLDRDRDGFTVELQHLARSERLDVVSGFRYLDLDSERRQVLFVEIPFFPDLIPVPVPDQRESLVNKALYTYANFGVLDDLTLIAGLGLESFRRGQQIDREQVSPKLGVIWEPLDDTVVRASGFRVLNPTTLFRETIEPTQVAGFNQFFDDIEGSDAWRYGIAVDQKIGSSLFAGAEYAERRLDAPVIGVAEDKAPFYDLNEDFARAYLYWTPHDRWALSAQYQYERFDIDPNLVQGIVHSKTHRMSFGTSYFDLSGLSLHVTGTYTDQSGDFDPEDTGMVTISGQDNFWVTDVRVDYRLPRRFGLFSVGVKNLLDEEFELQDTDPDTPTVQPDRLVFGRLTLSF